MKHRIPMLVVLMSVSMLSSMLMMTPAFAQTTQPCEQCGMDVDAAGQARFRIVDASGGQHVACCPVCAFRLIPKYGELNITSFCDYNGPTYPITINAKQNGTALKLYPQTAMVLLGGGCTKNRIVYDSASADALLAPPNNGTSRWLPMMSNVTVLPNATRMTVAKAVLQYAGGVNSVCEQCGMTVDVTGQQRFRIFDATGTIHVACCPVCALRLQRVYNNLNITSFCDYYGPNFPITIVSKNNGTDVTVTPSDALIIAAGSCMKNRIVYNSTAADLLLAPPNNGTSRYLSTLQNDTVAANATRLSIVQAALMNGAGVPNPTPTPTPTASPSPSPIPTSSPTIAPTPTPTQSPTQSVEPSSSPEETSGPNETPATSASPTSEPTSSPETSNPPTTATAPPSDAILECEACGMDVTAESRARYKVTDGNGNTHYVECFMCALQLINDYETLHIETYCDWNGPSYPITVDTTNYGNGTFSVSPSTAMYLRGGSCVTARAAYDQAAADNLLANGYSQYTSPEQRYALPSNTEVKTIIDAINTWYAQPKTTDNPTSLMLVLIAVVGVAVVGGSMFAYRKLRRNIS